MLVYITTLYIHMSIVVSNQTQHLATSSFNSIFNLLGLAPIKRRKNQRSKLQPYVSKATIQRCSSPENILPLKNYVSTLTAGQLQVLQTHCPWSLGIGKTLKECCTLQTQHPERYSNVPLRPLYSQSNSTFTICSIISNSIFS